MEYIVPAGELNATKCMEILKNSAGVRDVVKLVSDLEYGPVLENALEKYDKTGELLALEVAVDRHVYSRIWKAIKKLRGLDGRIARTILGLEIDSMNIRVILRLQEAGISQDQAREYLIPISEVFGQKGLEGAMQAKEARSTIEQLLEAAKVSLARDHQQLLKDLIREYETHKSLSHLETVLDRGLLKTSLRMLKRYTPFFNIGVILAFLNLKWFELRNLRIIIKGAEEKMPLARTTELLILP
jgi:vacuolar-type H+-ATPase subunit C/Vma6